MSLSYSQAADMFTGRNRNRPFRRLSHSCTLRFDKERDCYIHKHYNTDTVEIHRNKYVVYTGGWDTSTTWANIWKIVPLRACKPPLDTIRENKLVVWHEGGVRKFSPFYDGIEVDQYGVPLEPKPCRVRVLVKGTTDEFNRVARSVREILKARILLGEWDNVDEKPVKGEHVFELMQEIAVRAGPGLFAEWIDTEKASQLFAYRPAQVFGRRSFIDLSPVFVPAAKRLDSNIAAARRYWVQEYAETKEIEKEFF